MKPITELTEAEIRTELERYRDRAARLKKDYNERVANLADGVEMLAKELMRRNALPHCPGKN